MSETGSREQVSERSSSRASTDGSKTASEHSSSTDVPKTSSERSSSSSSELCSSSSNRASNILNYIFFIIVAAIIVIIAITYYRWQCNKELASNVELIDKMKVHEELLKHKLQESEQSKVLYSNRIKSLSNEIELLHRKQQELTQSHVYNPVLPMNETTYDAPDPELKREKSKQLKDKEAIKSYVNSKRETVQDAIDKQQQSEEQQQQETQLTVEKELKHQIDNQYSDEEQVDNIMSIIQSS